ncbi:MAG: tRNA preQ1(34) S-adenosylmethionine ribosyltransferase-isomerase QueA [Candidatus Acidiferrum sp.]
MRLDELNYELPRELIAQHPLENRGDSRLLKVERYRGSYEDCTFSELPELLTGDELVVLNNVRVTPARLRGRRLLTHADKGADAESSKAVEVFLTRQLDAETWEALVRPGRKMPIGQRVVFGDGELEAEVTRRGNRGLRSVKLISRGGGTITKHLERLGHVPLPPYIDRPDETMDRERYQTVFAKRPGAIAAPTAGLHFTEELLEKVRACGAEICELTLEVGLGTFQPVRGETLEDHVMHAESYEIPRETAEQINEARRAGRKILAVGTTVVRALESAALRAIEAGVADAVVSGKAESNLFIIPGFKFQVVDQLLTNFHLPRSTLLALVCAFGGHETILGAYHHAVKAGFRFYSYGDCMLVR